MTTKSPTGQYFNLHKSIIRISARNTDSGDSTGSLYLLKKDLHITKLLNIIFDEDMLKELYKVEENFYTINGKFNNLLEIIKKSHKYYSDDSYSEENIIYKLLFIKIKFLNDNVIILNNDLTSMSDGLTILSDDLTSLSENVTTLSENVTTLSENFTSLNENFTTLCGEINILKKQAKKSIFETFENIVKKFIYLYILYFIVKKIFV